MNFNEKNHTEKIGRITGFLVMYFIFTTILFFILKLTNKLPAKWTYIHIMIIVVLILFLGNLIKFLLKT